MSIYDGIPSDVSHTLNGFTWDNYIALKAEDESYWRLSRVSFNPDTTLTLTLVDMFYTASDALAGAEFDKQHREGN